MLSSVLRLFGSDATDSNPLNPRVGLSEPTNCAVNGDDADYSCEHCPPCCFRHPVRDNVLTTADGYASEVAFELLSTNIFF